MCIHQARTPESEEETHQRSRGWETCSGPQLVTSIWAQVLLQAAPLKVYPGTSVGVPLSRSLYRNCSWSRSLHRGHGALIPVLTSCLFNCSSPSLPHPTSNTLDSSVARPLTLLVPLPCYKHSLDKGWPRDSVSRGSRCGEPDWRSLERRGCWTLTTGNF
jgi:hypothetical protein